MLNNKPAIDDFTAKKLDDIKDVDLSLNQLRINMEVASDLSRRSSISSEIAVKIFNSNLKEDLELCDEVIRLMKAIKNTISDKNE